MLIQKFSCALGEVEVLPVGRRVTNVFVNWQKLLTDLVDFSLQTKSRETAKDTMVIIQKIIIGCRAARQFQRDTIPPEQEISIRFNEFEWGFLVAVTRSIQRTGEQEQSQ